jgi:hypothetical protein
LDRCKIVGDNTELKPVKVISPRLDEYVTGRLRLTIDQSRIAAVHLSNNSVAWASQIACDCWVWSHYESFIPSELAFSAVLLQQR